MVGGAEKERAANIPGWDETQARRQFCVIRWRDMWGWLPTEIRRITAGDNVWNKSRRGDGRFQRK